MKLLNKKSNLKEILFNYENLQSSFDYFQVNIASPKKIKSWSSRILPNGDILGEIKNTNTINLKTNIPEEYGLFCEKIFGPIKDYECSCGKFNGFALNNICDKCFVELTDSRVRRYRMAYIELSVPIIHSWYLKGNPSYLSIILNSVYEDIHLSNINDILYFKNESDFNNNPIVKLFNLNSSKFKKEIENKNLNIFSNFLKNNLNIKKISGTEIIKSLLESIDLKYEVSRLRSSLDIYSNSSLTNTNLIKKIRILESFLSTNTNLSWIILTVLPVLPPGLRPFVKLPNRKLSMSAINEIYKLIILRSKNISKLMANSSISNLLYNQACKSLQIIIDLLIDNNKDQSLDNKFSINNRSFKSLTQLLEGKQGKFRQNLLGKRVDYSGRSVIVVNPTLKLNQCGLPYKIAVEIFKPFLINEISKLNNFSTNSNSKFINQIIDNNQPYIWTLLENLMRKHDILLNRAPTLHRFGIQSFNPVLTLTNAIYLHPLLCTGFNADFDGDQMAVHLPLYKSSQLEVQKMMRPSYNVLSSSNGKTILMPSQEMVFGCYYLTMMINKTNLTSKKYYNNEKMALLSYYNKNINLHTPILVLYSKINFKFKIKNEIIYLLANNKYYKKSKIKILSKYSINLNKYCFLTTIGLIVAYQTNDLFKINSLFLETTPGRLIFSKNLNDKILKY
jgi:DNA-directed RNA polymerase subunit beta'